MDNALEQTRQKVNNGGMLNKAPRGHYEEKESERVLRTPELHPRRLHFGRRDGTQAGDESLLCQIKIEKENSSTESSIGEMKTATASGEEADSLEVGIRDSDKNSNQTATRQGYNQDGSRIFPYPFYDVKSGKLMTDPVVDPEGESLERSTLDDTSAGSRDIMQDKTEPEYYPNIALRAILEHLIQLADPTLHGSLRRFEENTKAGFGFLVERSVFRQYHKPLPRCLYCPLTQDVLNDPVIAPDGITYEGEAIRKWVGLYGAIPGDDEILVTLDDLRENCALYDVLQLEKSRSLDSIHPSFRRVNLERQRKRMNEKMRIARDKDKRQSKASTIGEMKTDVKDADSLEVGTLDKNRNQATTGIQGYNQDGSRIFPFPFYDKSGKLMTDPVVDPKGESFDRSTSYASKALYPKRYYPNIALRAILEHLIQLADPTLHDVSLGSFEENREEGSGLAELAVFRQQEKPLPECLYCPLTHDILSDPVIAPDGVTYEGKAIRKWVGLYGHIPGNGKFHVALDDLRENCAIFDVLQLEKDHSVDSIDLSFRPANLEKEDRKRQRQELCQSAVEWLLTLLVVLLVVSLGILYIVAIFLFPMVHAILDVVLSVINVFVNDESRQRP